MIIERTSKEILLRLPADTDILSLQRIVNILKYKKAIKDSQATEKDASKLADDLNANWWKKNKSRFIK